MTDDLRLRIRALLEAHMDLPDDDDAELGMSSLLVVQLVESLEESFELLFRADEIEASRWRSISTITAFVRGKLGAS
jgi:acyl carrier protein